MTVQNVTKNALLCSVAFMTALTLAGCKSKSGSGNPPPQLVKFVKVHTEAVPVNTALPGRVSAFEQAQIRPQVGGVVLKRYFEQGTDVKKDQLLYLINPAPYKAAYETAKAQLLHARAAAIGIRAQYERYKPLVKAHAVSQQDFDNTRSQALQAEAAIATAQATLDSAAVNLDWTEVRSPIEGRIGRMLYTPGTLVTAGQVDPIALVTRLDPIYVDVNLAASDMLRLRREIADGTLKKVDEGDASVELMLEDGSKYDLPGVLRLSEVTVDPGTGTLVLRAQFPNPDKLLMPGMYVHAQVKEGVDPTSVVVPQEAVMRNSRGDPYVFVIDDKNQLDTKMVELGRAIHGKWVVRKGLKDNDRVVVSGLVKVKSGQKVTPEEQTTPAPKTQEK
ncbi:efflux RND transporter periplasmic adaptor subunit [Candidatus Kirkpatrickella diaphorinae]|uniref:Efflux RND transporter periplasmic adaptor subunit n=1 Tax=Candidatus Kirkpatrickella diaphorinae TaxID=2984322 RepID=A0ABY6GKU2_9PROT|nr:efflux RND transporter periplasmic adaptor subunit [Candidatus Kirkpatrickella diaphorinae]UYH51939.1 efflux RND transporter periplasmic adaptor subunit [Candidatus Kirkpatrickella diaphorinae]